MCSVTVTFTDKRSYVPDEPARWQEDDEKWPHGWQVDPLQATGNDFIEYILFVMFTLIIMNQDPVCILELLYVCFFLIKHLHGCFS